MITNFRASDKTKVPACCSFDCCGNKFGRIERRMHGRIHGINKIIRSRRYAKRAERNVIRKEIANAIKEYND